MYKKLFYNLLLLLFSLTATAQEPADTPAGYCGTPPGVSAWLREWHDHPEQFAARSADTLYAGIQVHLLARNDGVGRISPEKLLDAMCQLNQDYAASGVRFYFKHDWNLVNNTVWHSHNNIPSGIQMMQANDVPDAQNSYFVANPAGNCGYNLPYASVALRHSCVDAGEHTWAHEIGHALSLPHTFIGWENTNYNFNNPTPETVLYDYTYFHDTLETTVPAPLDTALVERVDGSNCGIAADLFCDTPPDYLNFRWPCDGQGQSTATLKDQTGATFKADGTLFMSYSVDECANRFSDEEIAALRANLLTEKAAWLGAGPPAPDVAGLPVPLSPAGGAELPASEVSLHWTAVPGATRYVVQVSRFANFSFKIVDVVTTDTVFDAPALPPFPYFWRVRPFNYWDVCTEFSGSETFVALAASSVEEGRTPGSLRCYPTLPAPGQALTLELPADWVGETARCRVFDAAGRLCWQNEQTPSGDKVFVGLPLETWPAGVYRLVWTNRLGQRSATFVRGKD